MTSIFELIDADDAQGVRTLLTANPGAADDRDEQGLSPLVHAAYRGRGPVFEAIRDLVPARDPWDRLIAGESNGLPAPDAWSADGFTPLHLAAFAHNAPAARSLLEAGADPEAVSTASFARVTPLGTCAFVGATDVARVLLEHGADPSIGEDARSTPLAVAEANGYQERADLLRRAD
jgi:ankyrin repeat protein